MQWSTNSLPNTYYPCGLWITRLFKLSISVFLHVRWGFIYLPIYSWTPTSLPKLENSREWELYPVSIPSPFPSFLSLASCPPSHCYGWLGPKFSCTTRHHAGCRLWFSHECHPISSPFASLPWGVIVRSMMLSVLLKAWTHKLRDLSWVINWGPLTQAECLLPYSD